jgi:hypothetical protein
VWSAPASFNQASRAPSVELPTTIVLPPFSSSVAVELTDAFSPTHSIAPRPGERTRSRVTGVVAPAARSRTAPPTPTRTTRILFWVRVPVLSEQMTVADPIVSQATSCLTSELARVIFRIARASETVTLIGSPSGTATTTMMTM